MSATITLTRASTTLRRPLIIKFSLADIFRTQAFKIAAEVITIISLFAAAAVWTLAIPTL